MSGRSPAVCKIYNLGRDSPGKREMSRRNLYKAGFRDVPSVGEGGTAALSICITLKLRRMLLI